VLAVVASPSGAGFTSFGRLATPTLRNEAEPSSRDATARAFASPSLNEQGRPHWLRVRLHDFRPIIMINSSQLTRTSQACLALSESTRINANAEAPATASLQSRHSITPFLHYSTTPQAVGVNHHGFMFHPSSFILLPYIENPFSVRARQTRIAGNR
jgi:hypothetical protein